METLPVTVATFVSVLTNVTVTPPAGAGVDRLIGRLSAWPSPRVGSEPGLITLLVTVMSTVLGAKSVAVPVMVVVPTAAPVIVKGAEVAPGSIVTVLGTSVTTPIRRCRPA
jgi:hypothetical protein